MKAAGRVIVHGEEAAELYTTYGVPPELVENDGRRAELRVRLGRLSQGDGRARRKVGQDRRCRLQDRPARSARRRRCKHTEFLGYETTEADGRSSRHRRPGAAARCSSPKSATRSRCTVVLDRSPFYGESGGQVGDTGEIVGEGFEFEVTDTQKDGDLIVHIGHLRQGHDESRREGDGPRRCEPPARHSPGPLGHAHPALRPAEERSARTPSRRARRSRTTGCGSTSPIPSPVEAEQLAAIERDVAEQGRRGRADRLEVRPARRGPRGRRDDAVRREVSRPGPHGQHGRVQPRTVRRHAPGQHAARSARSRSSPKKASPPARAASRRSPARRPRSTSRKRRAALGENRAASSASAWPMCPRPPSAWRSTSAT